MVGLNLKELQRRVKQVLNLNQASSALNKLKCSRNRPNAQKRYRNNDILDFSKIESGNMELDEHDLDLRTCIEEVLDVFAVKAAATGLDLLYEMDHNVPATIEADGLRL